MSVCFYSSFEGSCYYSGLACFLFLFFFFFLDFGCYTSGSEIPSISLIKASLALSTSS